MVGLPSVITFTGLAIPLHLHRTLPQLKGVNKTLFQILLPFKGVCQIVIFQ